MKIIHHIFKKESGSFRWQALCIFGPSPTWLNPCLTPSLRPRGAKRQGAGVKEMKMMYGLLAPILLSLSWPLGTLHPSLLVSDRHAQPYTHAQTLSWTNAYTIPHTTRNTHTHSITHKITHSHAHTHIFTLLKQGKVFVIYKGSVWRVVVYYWLLERV